MSGIDRQRLAAILAADAQGYSRLMELDERTTVAALAATRDVFKAEIESNHGHVINMVRHHAMKSSHVRKSWRVATTLP